MVCPPEIMKRDIGAGAEGRKTEGMGRESLPNGSEVRVPVFDFAGYSEEIMASCEARCKAKLEELHLHRMAMRLPLPQNIDKYQHKRYYPEEYEDMLSASQ